MLFTGEDLRANYDLAAKLVKQIQQIPGAVDTHIHQRLDLPTLALHMDRTQLQTVGLSANDVAQNLLDIDRGYRADLARFLVRSVQRRGLQRDRPVAAIHGRQHGRAVAHARQLRCREPGAIAQQFGFGDPDGATCRNVAL